MAYHSSGAVHMHAMLRLGRKIMLGDGPNGRMDA